MLPFGLSAQKLKKSSLETLTKDKLNTFKFGLVQKSRLQKAGSGPPASGHGLTRRRGPQAKEEREAKQKKAEEDAAKVYEQFVASFAEEDDAGGQTFVRGGVRRLARARRPRGCLTGDAPSRKCKLAKMWIAAEAERRTAWAGGGTTRPRPAARWTACCAR